MAEVTKTSKINTFSIRKHGRICIATIRGLSGLTVGSYVDVATINSSEFYPSMDTTIGVFDANHKPAAIKITTSGKLQGYGYANTDCQCYANIPYMAKV